MFQANLLGRFELRVHNQPIELPSRPAQALLAFLLLHPGVAHRRELLAGLLWPDSSEANARRNLRQALWQLRRSLGPDVTLLHSDDLVVTLQLHEQDQLDVALLQQPLQASTTNAELINRVEYYVGELLPGFYDDWIVRERERLQAQYEATLHTLIDRLLEDAEWRAVLKWAEHWIATSSTPEPAYRALMRAHAALGDMANVAEVYRRCVETLAHELEVEPSAQTRHLYEQLRQGTRPLVATLRPLVEASTSPAQHSLPVHLTSFIGRVDQLAAMQRLLSEERLVTLTGSGGTGKTRLAIEFAHQASKSTTPPHFCDGIWLVELALVAEPGRILQALASTLNLREESGSPLLQSILGFLRDKTALLIFDNCEHLVDACARLVDQLLRVCSGIKVLVTSREMLGVIGESVLRVPSLTMPTELRSLAPQTLLRYEAVRLFVERAAAVRPEFQLNEENAKAIVQICRQLDGVPLAIELAAARVRSLTPTQISARLDDRFRLLTGGSRTALPRQQTLRAMIDWSWDLLSEAECMLLRRLTVFRGGWTLEAAESICVDGQAMREQRGSSLTIDDGDVLDLLTHLVDKSLVIMDEQADGARYHLLETIRQYALEKLLTAGETESVRSQHLAYYLALAETAAPQLRTGDQLRWLAQLDIEHDNLRAALQWAAGSAWPEVGLRLTGALALFWYLRGYWTEGRAWLQLMVEQPVDTDQAAKSLLRARSGALAGAGWLADEDGSEIPYYTESLALSRQIGDRWGEAFALRGLATVTANWANLEQAEPPLRQSLALFTELADDWGIALARFNLGWLTLDRDGNREAETHWQIGLKHFQRCGDRWGIAVTMGALGYVARLRGHYDRASELMGAGLQQFLELGDKTGVALLLLRLGNLAFRRSDYREAIALLNEAMLLARGHQEQRNLIAILQVQGMVACYQGEYEQAETLLNESLVLAQNRNIEVEITDGLSYLAFVMYQADRLPQAADLFQRTLSQEQDREGLAFAEYGMGLVAIQQGAFEQASQWLQNSSVRYQALGDRRAYAAVLDAQGRVALALADLSGAQSCFRESLLLRRSMGDKQGIAESLERIASSTSEPQLQTQLLSVATKLRQSIGAPWPPVEQPALQQILSKARQALGEQHYQERWQASQNWSYEQAINTALIAAGEEVPSPDAEHLEGE